MTPPLISWVGFVLAALLVAAAVWDLRTGRIPNVLTYPSVAIGLIVHTLVGGLTGDDQHLGLAGSLAGLAVGFLPLAAAWAAGGIGGGDAKLMAAVGALGGWQLALATLFYGLIAAAVMAIGIMVRRRIVRRTLMRILRFLVLSASPSRPAGPTAADSPKVAFGLALCIGAAAAVAELATAGGTWWLLK